MSYRQTFLERIKLHEGFRSSAYRDAMDKLTIGYGFCLEHRIEDPILYRAFDEGYITIGVRAADFLLEEELKVVEDILQQKLPWITELDISRYEVILEMAYNLGVNGLLGFKKMLAALQEKRWNDAADEMLDSAWAKQVRHRATVLADIMREGRGKV